MGQYITIDQGNTHTKISLWELQDNAAPLLISTQVRPLMAPSDGTFYVDELMPSISCEGVIVSSVLTRTPYIAVRDKTIPYIWLSHETPLPIKVNYEHPETLGTDRIAAVIGARAVVPEGHLLVVDAGTAVTFDVLDADNVYCGGNIAAGLDMRLKALNEYTSRLPRVYPKIPTDLLGHDTVSALNNGAVHGLIAEIRYYLKRMPKEAAMILTGGDIHFLKTALTFDFLRSKHTLLVEPALVERGLIEIFKYNLKKGYI